LEQQTTLNEEKAQKESFLSGNTTSEQHASTNRLSPLTSASHEKETKLTNQTSLPSFIPVFVAKCPGCNLTEELKVCEFCQYPKCSACIEKHQQAEKISQEKAKMEAQIDCLRKRTGKEHLF
jgi:hypothetical protein